jgi:hypothetical protein
MYLGNAQAQVGFEAAVQATSAVKSQLEGQTEKLTRHTVAGGVVYTNRPTADQPLSYNLGLPGTQATVPPEASESTPTSPSWLPAGGATPQPWGQDLFGDPTWTLDTQAAEPVQKKPARIDKPRTRSEVLAALNENRLKAFHRKEPAHPGRRAQV